VDVGKLLGAVFLGWALGANDAANVFGPAVMSRALSYRRAVVTAALLVVLGAALGGRRALETIGALGSQTPVTALLVTLAAALAMTVLILLRMPASSSHSIVGAIVGAALAREANLDVSAVLRLVRGWVATPALACVLAWAWTLLVSASLRSGVAQRMGTLDEFVRTSLWLVGAWGAYALGANNAANVTGVFVASGSVSTAQAAWIAGGSIALGILTFGRRMMQLVGRNLVRLEPSTALIAMLAQALTVHLFAVWGVPVSASQALAGAVLGIGLAKGVRTINPHALLHIVMGWLGTPLVGAVFAYVLLEVFGPG
jgi:PiT family inorganic phosphate transporter